MNVLVKALRRIQLHGGRVVLPVGAEAELPLGLAVHLVRSSIAAPVDADGRDWVCIAWWLQDQIPRPALGTRARLRVARQRKEKANHEHRT